MVGGGVPMKLQLVVWKSKQFNKKYKKKVASFGTL